MAIYSTFSAHFTMFHQMGWQEAFPQNLKKNEPHDIYKISLFKKHVLQPIFCFKKIIIKKKRNAFFKVVSRHVRVKILSTEFKWFDL